ncbi:FCD domain-containing protein [Vibrio gazogenes]|uniref:Transcriptional regulator, GntR family n=1 Tax=Vibrio gazogenes DSM 21264 = NBRC 103151 TaxID=1123492 RepID=A0A1M5GFB1_VIBGA|nr:FCD domain-containing protein [Vibrio gazogenes]USP14626.1 FCD domain-containing protein [Vibrio gazogenes]SHG02414.1 transcriptional regulator, GntR family [Vibrio gazogenes DSM 21264] [Vibrio gazogenes DSM 21264 = NBRC 103151]SJN56043.1 HTH-type transcriptional regulator LutR [Vibrio gazogenes]
MNISATPPKRLYQEIGLTLQQRIFSGEFSIGERLPPERDIAEAMQVSRSVVREAIIMLELQGLVEVRKGSGVYVIALSHQDPQPSQPSMPKTRSDIGPFELLQARQIIESQIASFAATNLTKNDFSKLREALDIERKQLETGHGDYDGDEQFHLAIAYASQNSVLCDIVRDLWQRRDESPMWRQLHARITNKNYRGAWLEDHEKILFALQRRSPEAAKEAMWQHLEHVKQTLFHLSDADDPQFDGFLFQ